MSKSKILFQMTGSIACYKACQVISGLVRIGHEVQVVATPSALQFVGAATLEGLTGKPVVSDLFASGNVMDHIHLVRWADLILVAPATANFINKAARGVGDDLISTQFLAHDFRKPYLIAPAMNTMMYQHPVTQSSVKSLKEMGVQILETASGVLACGEVGFGRLLDPALILQEVETHLQQVPSPIERLIPHSSGVKVLVTSGGTEESLDPVRVVTNKSTGATGAALTDTLTQFGFDVTYLHAESAKLPETDCEKVSFGDFESLQSRLQNLLGNSKFKAVIHLAAVSDFSPVKSSDKKISSDQDLTVNFKKNPKLVDHLREMAHDPKLKVVAFKLTAGASDAEKSVAVEKLWSRSKADLVVQNDTDQKGVFHIHKGVEKTETLPSKQALGMYLGEYLTKELL
ncbi:MAG: bifunctional phosphopantothenoylcysteine decarboxylase/phosphopantothenate--cysteine ligase CoaBC [Pseudobdellovibrionaceae bacterium]